MSNRTESTGTVKSSINSERGATHGLELILFLLQQRLLVLLLIPTVIAAVAAVVFHLGVLGIVLTWVAVPLLGIGVPVAILIRNSYRQDRGGGDWEPYLDWKSETTGRTWRNRKIPMETFYEAYMAGEVDFKKDVYETLLHRNELFRFCITSNDARFYLKDFLGQNVDHSQKSDEGEIAPVYNRGNDFYNWFLGESMTYTSGLFEDQDDSLEDAQRRKLEMVCQTVQMQPGDRHLDIGCGWGPLINHAARYHNTNSTGYTLAEEQADWANARAADLGVSDRVNVVVDDYRNIPNQKYDKITCLEMAEHVGIKNFQKFLLQVRGLLEDDGIFYLQIAGLRRRWQFEDLVWGLFMGKYVFPAADASCPLGFVTSQLERAGFEVHRVENTGVHYSLTIKQWYENWKRNEAEIVEAYGQRWFRKWMIFLGWSTVIAAQGSSTVFMITLTKNIKNDKSSVSSEEAESVPFSRMDRWIGKDKVATQQ